MSGRTKNKVWVDRMEKMIFMCLVGHGFPPNSFIPTNQNKGDKLSLFLCGLWDGLMGHSNSSGNVSSPHKSNDTVFFKPIPASPEHGGDM